MKTTTNATRRSILKQLVKSRYISDYNITWDLRGIEGVAEERFSGSQRRVLKWDFLITRKSLKAPINAETFSTNRSPIRN